MFLLTHTLNLISNPFSYPPSLTGAFAVDDRISIPLISSSSHLEWPPFCEEPSAEFYLLQSQG